MEPFGFDRPSAEFSRRSGDDRRRRQMRRFVDRRIVDRRMQTAAVAVQRRGVQERRSGRERRERDRRSGRDRRAVPDHGSSALARPSGEY